MGIKGWIVVIVAFCILGFFSGKSFDMIKSRKKVSECIVSGRNEIIYKTAELTCVLSDYYAVKEDEYGALVSIYTKYASWLNSNFLDKQYRFAGKYKKNFFAESMCGFLQENTGHYGQFLFDKDEENIVAHKLMYACTIVLCPDDERGKKMARQEKKRVKWAMNYYGKDDE